MNNSLVTNPAEDAKGIYYISVTDRDGAEVASIYRTEQATWLVTFSKPEEKRNFESLEAAEAWTWAIYLDLQARLQKMVHELAYA